MASKEEIFDIKKFYDTGKLCCGYYTEPFDGELVWCTHPDNKNQLEGNCQPNDCPIKTHIDELTKSRELFS